jgi:TfoX/Sxy family transcriptional regulator of competence genes
MAFNTELAERMTKLATGKLGISETKMFGGCGLLVNGNMSLGVQKDYLIIRVGKDSWEDALNQPGAKEMDFTGRSMRGWVMIHRDELADDQYLKQWVDAGLSFAACLPAK